VDEKRNMIVIKDTPDAIRMAERLVAAQDLADPEVVLEVEVLQVNTTRLLELGVRWPEQVLFQDPSTVPQPGLPGTVTAATSLQRASGGLTAFVATPALLLRLNQEVGATKLLANPRIRVKNREKARIQIGDRVPVITTTLVTGGFSTESVSYLDVGLLLEVEPTISLDDEVSMKVGLEVSNIVREVRTESGSLVYQIGTRNASTLLRLGNGETQVLAGLISDEDRQTASGVPGLTDLPVLNRLFSVTSDQTERTEIVLLITPHLVRTLARPDNRVIEFSAGTQGPAGQVRTAPTPRQQSPVAKPPTSKPAEKPAAPPTTFRPGMQPPSR
jgi:general secretion pathway protein D